jgi:hypothetical protein
LPCDIPPVIALECLACAADSADCEDAGCHALLDRQEPTGSLPFQLVVSVFDRTQTMATGECFHPFWDADGCRRKDGVFMGFFQENVEFLGHDF